MFYATHACAKGVHCTACASNFASEIASASSIASASKIASASAGNLLIFITTVIKTISD